MDIETAQQMFDAVLPQAPQHDIFIATAAVADWRPRSYSDRKLKKQPGGQAASLELDENPDVLAAVSRLPQRPFCVGFAAESHDVREKQVRKNVPLIVGNLGSAAFGADDNALTLVDANGHRELPRADKLTLARQLVGEIAARISTGST
mgnify:CR=1 FL=1